MLSPRVSLAIVGLMVLLISMLATLQYRWIAQVSEAERSRLKTSLDQATAGFCKDFDREIARVYAHFNLEQPEDEAQLPWLLADRLRTWREKADWPELIGELDVIRREVSGEIVLLCFDEEAKTLLRCDWEDDLLPIRRGLRDQGRGIPAVHGALPGMILAIERRWPSQAEIPFDWQPPRDHVVIRFDLDFMTGVLFPRLAEKHFAGTSELAYAVTISSVRAPAQIVFQAGPQPISNSVQPDASGRLFALRPPADLSVRLPERPRPPRRLSADRSQPPPDRPQSQNPPPPGFHVRTEQGRWVLSVRHPEGSLEEVVAKARRRNMLISLAALAMLGATAALMMLSTRSARRLARQQMDFVAAVSHELRTPLTAIRSAGQNLADGIVDDPERVRGYGQLIEREGRRLTEMIGRVLTFAGIRSGRESYRMAPVAVAEVVRASLEDRAWHLEEKNFEVQTEINNDVPRVKGDASALRQVFTNLVDNALKYAEAGRWLGVSVRPGHLNGNDAVRISFSDHGPGISKKEQALVFEPFLRGAEAAGSNISGSGLGLAVVRSIVEAHDGNVEVVPVPGGGAMFVVRLPVEPARGSGDGE